MGYMEVYKSWCDNMYFDEATRDELKSIANDEKEIEDRFYKDLEFGTGGLIAGLGWNGLLILVLIWKISGMVQCLYLERLNLMRELVS